ncbi:helix-turn-helix transcriptional regulator [Candidatus Pacearchaeota archaeon]|nr:helix-turn-helix transcriptional regulator [Candidatus Pacearchaeota archaeon]
MISENILDSCHKQGFEEEEVFGAYKIFFGTLVSESRLKIINLLRKGKKNVSEIITQLKMDQTSVSHDLARLKQCGFVNVEIEGKYRYYKLNEETIKPLMNLIDKHMSGNCIHILKSMKGGNKK